MHILLCSKTGAIDGQYTNNVSIKELRNLCKNLNDRYEDLGCNFQIFEHKSNEDFCFDVSLFHIEKLKK